VSEATAPDDLRVLAVAIQDLARAVRQSESGPPRLPATELEIIRYVDAHPGTSVGGVAEALGLQQSNVSAAVRGLVARGLVERTADPEDRRVARLRSTAVAGRNREVVETGWAQWLGSALGELDDADAAAVRAAAAPLARLAAHARGPALRGGPGDGAAGRDGPGPTIR
jgi:DNA-binding MarR family transcriptional regulator